MSQWLELGFSWIHGFSRKSDQAMYHLYSFGYESIRINTIFRGMNIHLPAILMFTRGTGF